MKKLVVTLMIIMIMTPSLAYGHSGGTDSAGGHNDKYNVSGLGTYHFHHGYAPHLHINNICPFVSAVAGNETVLATSSESNYQNPKNIDAEIRRQTAIAENLEMKAELIRPTQNPDKNIYWIVGGCMVAIFGIFVLIVRYGKLYI